MAHNLIFETDGSWEGTALLDNGEPYFAAQVFVQLRVDRNMFDRITGRAGEAFVVPVYENGDGDTVVLEREPIFPGVLDIQTPKGRVRVENYHPDFAADQTRVFWEGLEVTDQIVEFYFDVNHPDNVVRSHLTLFKGNRFRADELTQVTLL